MRSPSSRACAISTGRSGLASPQRSPATRPRSSRTVVPRSPTATRCEPSSVCREVRRDEDKGVQGMNKDKPVFRVERSKAMRLAKMFGLPVILLGMLAGRMAHTGLEIEMWKVFLIAGGLALMGLAIGRLLP